MANRYLIGTGARNWNDVANWSETSGGAGGASVPTSTDAVFLDANSGTGTITLNADANCLSFDASALGSALTIAGSVFLFNCYGSFTGNSFLTFTLTGTSYFYSRGTGTITQGGATLTWQRWYINAPGGTITNGDNFTSNSLWCYLSNGIWETNDKTIQVIDLSTYTGINTLTLGSSTLNLRRSMTLAVGEDKVFNCGTSLIDFTLAGECFLGSNGRTFNDVKIHTSDYASPSNITGGGIFNNLTITNNNDNYDIFVINPGVTVNGILTLNGYNSNTKRLLLALNTIGTPRTITCNGSIVASNVDFRNIVIAGTAAPFDASAIPGGSGDCGGNSGITFTPAQKQYFKHTSDAVSWSDSTKWFSDEAKTIAGRVPLPQDDVQFDAGSFTGDSTLTVNCPRIGKSLDMSAVSQAVTITLANNIECYGSFVLGENITPSGSYVRILMGRGAYNLNLYGKSIYQLTINAFGGTYTNLSDLVISYNANACLRIINGTFDLNDFNSTLVGGINIASGSTIYMGNGTYEKTYSAISDAINLIELSAGSNFYCEGSTIKSNPSYGTSKITLVGAGKTFNKLWVSGSHTGNFDISGSNTIAELIIDSGRTVRPTGGSTQTIAKITAIGTPEAPITITSSTTTPFNLVKTGAGLVNVSNCNISYSKALPANRFFAMDSVDGGNNTGWNFGQIGASPGEIGLSVIEDAEAEVIGEAILSPNFSEMEELGCQAFADAAILELSLSEAESMDADAFGEAVISPDFEEVEIMDADLKATAYASADFMEHEQAGDDHGVLRMFENIIAEVSIDGRLYGETSFSTDINSEGEIL